MIYGEPNFELSDNLTQSGSGLWSDCGNGQKRSLLLFREKYVYRLIRRFVEVYGQIFIRRAANVTLDLSVHNGNYRLSGSESGRKPICGERTARSWRWYRCNYVCNRQPATAAQTPTPTPTPAPVPPKLAASTPTHRNQRRLRFQANQSLPAGVYTISANRSKSFGRLRISPRNNGALLQTRRQKWLDLNQLWLNRSGVVCIELQPNTAVKALEFMA